MALEVSALRLTVLVGSDARWRHCPLHVEIVRRARRAGLTGATVVRGIQGYGTSAARFSDRASLFRRAPLAVIMVDDAPRIRAFLPQLDEVMCGGLAILDPVTVISSTRGPTRR